MRTSHMLCIFDLVHPGSVAAIRAPARCSLQGVLLGVAALAFGWMVLRPARARLPLPVRCTRSRPPVRGGAAGGGAAPGRLDAGRRRRLADYGARSLVSSVDCRCSCTGPVPANPGRRVHASYLTHAGGAGIELSSVYRYHRLHATGDKRNTRHETPFHARTVPEPVYVSADSANSRAAHDSTDRVLA